MEAARDWIGGIAGFATVGSLIVSLSMSWRVWRARDSSGVAFLPIAAENIRLLAFLLYGIASGDSYVTWVNVCGLAITFTNATVHCAFSDDSGPGLSLLAALVVMCIALSMMTVDWLGYLASAWAVACNLSPIARILRMIPLPEIAACTLTTCGLWTAYAVLAGKSALVVNYMVGTLVAAVELTMAMLMWCRHSAYLPVQTV
ncbi:hypothetical protein HPB52_021831 [Rhipicephalus sanguineus]|uniref:Uncharacterized protein n=1 Tax=Rhipicephalus sanguineus TaxID=34632 RepID=A0A9D4PF01_RHISA|nr:hypothetical protein HPB52_021831 [Rhipicephalus sanguineus]